ncbi:MULTISPECIES: hypothetical protein [unclassified Streptomyces]|uniref:hypothetical protein n=1 Tax=unclassified Streptomyces TaxID=2593676 RepID=UPI0004C4EBFD|nr:MULTISPECIES: hypothetical protein [unclassified Streptomyces]KJY18623.1 hypothetical protein VR43_24060 [Streptomyces sp. NRRL S-104]
MTQKKDKADDGANGRRRQPSTTTAALAGALIGALAGLTGSTLAYFEAKDTRREEAQARRSDIRRAAYVELAGAANKYVQQATQLLTVSLDPAKTPQERRRQFESGYAPANTDLARAVTTARLVAPPEGRKDLAAIGARSARVGELATGWYGKGPEGVDTAKADAEFTEAANAQLAALQSFMDRAADESL